MSFFKVAREWLSWILYVHLRNLSKKQRKKNAQREFNKWLEKINPGDVVFDFGANYGEISKKIAKTGAIVHAYEPDPETFEQLVKNTREIDNIIPHQLAVGAADGEIKLYRGVNKEKWSAQRRSQAASIYSEGFDVNKNDHVTVPVRSINKIIEEAPTSIFLIKMDVEGAEVEVMEQMLNDGNIGKVSAVFVETHEHIFPKLFRRTQAVRKRVREIDTPYINLDWI